MSDKDSASKHKTQKKPFSQKFLIWLHHEIKRRHQDQNPKNELELPHDWATTWTAAATVWIAVFTFVLAGVGISQWKEMDAAGKQTDRLLCLYQQQLAQLSKQADDTHDLASQTKTLASRMKDQAETTATALHLDQRAWIVPQIGDFKWIPGSSMDIPARVINVGKTGARNVQLVASATVMNDTEVPDFIYGSVNGYPAIHTKSDFLYGSSSDPVKFNITAYKEGTHSHEILNFTPELANAMQAGNSHVIAYGHITYQDIFGISHWTNFCWITPDQPERVRHLKDWEIKCTAYNGTDNSK